jgi:hypothetical protein
MINIKIIIEKIFIPFVLSTINQSLYKLGENGKYESK